jgi:hypothetical protein
MRLYRASRGHSVSATTVVVSLLLAACGQPTAEQIVARTAEAMAGDVRIDDVRNVRIGMTYPDHEYPVVSEIGRPNRMRTEGVGRYVLVFDGERGAFLEQLPAEDGTPQGPALIDAAYGRDLELDIAFLFPAFFDHSSEYLGRELVDGVETHKLGVTLPLGIRTTYFIDATTYLPLKVIAEVTVDGTAYRPGRVFHEYADQGGVRYPRTVVHWWLEDQVDTAVVDLVEVNAALGEDRFVIPPGIR